MKLNKITEARRTKHALRTIRELTPALARAELNITLAQLSEINLCRKVLANAGTHTRMMLKQLFRIRELKRNLEQITK
jgi:hypothetical protein